MSRFTIRIPIRFRDVDVLGHVNHAVYFTYMEQARAEYWMKLFDLKELSQLAFIVAHAECDFKIAARFGDEIETSIWTSSVGNTSFVWQYEMRRAQTGELMAAGKTVQVYYDYSTQQGIAIPADVRAKLLAE